MTYNNGYNISRDISENNIGITKYFNSETCNSNSNSNSNCSNDYEISNIKNILNNWSDSFKNDLKVVNGYKTRLITSDELNSMGHIFYFGTAHAQVHQKSEYDCLYSNADYWTMSNTGDNQYEIDIVSKVDYNNKSQKVYSQFAIRPVINLKKCAIDNTCE